MNVQVRAKKKFASMWLLESVWRIYPTNLLFLLRFRRHPGCDALCWSNGGLSPDHSRNIFYYSNNFSSDGCQAESLRWFYLSVCVTAAEMETFSISISLQKSEHLSRDLLLLQWAFLPCWRKHCRPLMFLACTHSVFIEVLHSLSLSQISLSFTNHFFLEKRRLSNWWLMTGQS